MYNEDEMISKNKGYQEFDKINWWVKLGAYWLDNFPLQRQFLKRLTMRTIVAI